MKTLFIFITSILLAGCSVAGDKVETAPYTVIQADTAEKIELRVYDSMVLATTPMTKGEDEGRNSAFFRLFDYISGENTDQSKISMTAPVFMNDEQTNEPTEKTGQKIAMTAPVFMDEASTEPTMSFVLPKEYTLKTAPKPNNSDVTISEVKNYKVAAIRFSGFLSDSNVKKNKETLESWIKEQDLKTIGNHQKAGYNAPYTLPFLRRNEVLIPVE